MQKLKVGSRSVLLCVYLFLFVCLKWGRRGKKSTLSRVMGGDLGLMIDSS